jgi:glycosyltransferase involved in cell wall biosynthesis
LVFTDWFTPAFKAGGPIRSIVNLVDRFKSRYNIYVFTSDRDLNDSSSFDVQTDQWIEKDGYHIYYHSPRKMTFKKVNSVIADINPDKIYLNSMFSNMILPLLAASRTGKVILAPRGMLRPSALKVKPLKKILYITLLRWLKIEQQICFHATDAAESNNIKSIFPKASKIVEANNLPVSVDTELKKASKIKGDLKLIFVGRIHPIKNLLFLLESLQKVKGQITINIVATRDDQQYWLACKKAILKIQPAIEVIVSIALPHHKIKLMLENAHLFVLPTEGENFGHAIFEALAVGCPVLISDQTPWIGLRSLKAGVELPLVNKSRFTEVIQEFVEMPDATWQEYRQGAWSLATSYQQKLASAEQYHKLFGNAEYKQQNDANMLNTISKM